MAKEILYLISQKVGTKMKRRVFVSAVASSLAFFGIRQLQSDASPKPNDAAAPSPKPNDVVVEFVKRNCVMHGANSCECFLAGSTIKDVFISFKEIYCIPEGSSAFVDGVLRPYSYRLREGEQVQFLCTDTSIVGIKGVPREETLSTPTFKLSQPVSNWF